MTVEARNRAKASFKKKLDLPPLFQEVALRESGNAFAHAQAIAVESGAGTLTWVGRFDLVEFAVVLEPDEPLVSARRAIYAGLAALADALAVHAPPEIPLHYEFPASLMFNYGLAGGGQLAWPPNAKEKDRPDWLVFGAMIRTHIMDNLEPGERANAVSLEEEGFEDIGGGALVESFSRHLMMHMHEWQTNGFAKVAESYLSRVPAEPNTERSIDGAGDLLTRTKNKLDVKKQKLLPAIERALWIDHKTGEILL
jgi:biotin-(acetyl-CoA carboxylase) ligase